MALRQTRIEMAANARQASVELLNARLAEVIDLALATKQAHWNLRGPRFIAVHEMLDGFRATLDGHVDTIAERAVVLGGTAQGTLQEVAALTTLEPYPTKIHAVEEHLIALADRYGAVANALRTAIDSADEHGDKDTADLFTAASRDVDKALWFIEAHLIET